MKSDSTVAEPAIRPMPALPPWRFDVNRVNGRRWGMPPLLSAGAWPRPTLLEGAALACAVLCIAAFLLLLGPLCVFFAGADVAVACDGVARTVALAALLIGISFIYYVFV